MSESKDKKRRGRPAEKKLRFLNESSSLSEDQLRAYMRREGIHDAELNAMRAEALAGLTPKFLHRGKSPLEKRYERLYQRKMPPSTKVVGQDKAVE